MLDGITDERIKEVTTPAERHKLYKMAEKQDAGIKLSKKEASLHLSLLVRLGELERVPGGYKLVNFDKMKDDLEQEEFNERIGIL